VEDSNTERVKGKASIPMELLSDYSLPAHPLFSPRPLGEAGIPRMSDEPPAWAREILQRLGELSVRHEALHSEVADLRAHLLPVSGSPAEPVRIQKSPTELEFVELRSQLISATDPGDLFVVSHNEDLRDEMGGSPATGGSHSLEGVEDLPLPSQVIAPD